MKQYSCSMETSNHSISWINHGHLLSNTSRQHQAGSIKGDAGLPEQVVEYMSMMTFLLPLRSAIRVAMDMIVRHILTKEIENKLEVRILRLWVPDYGIMVQESVRHPRQCHSWHTRPHHRVIVHARKATNIIMSNHLCVSLQVAFLKIQWNSTTNQFIRVLIILHIKNYTRVQTHSVKFCIGCCIQDANTVMRVTSNLLLLA